MIVTLPTVVLLSGDVVQLSKYRVRRPQVAVEISGLSTTAATTRHGAAFPVDVVVGVFVMSASEAIAFAEGAALEGPS